MKKNTLSALLLGSAFLIPSFLIANDSTEDTSPVYVPSYYLSEDANSNNLSITTYEKDEDGVYQSTTKGLMFNALGDPTAEGASPTYYYWKTTTTTSRGKTTTTTTLASTTNYSDLTDGEYYFVVYTTSDNAALEITSDYGDIDNSFMGLTGAGTLYRGAMYIHATSDITVGNITGDFVENYTGSGGSGGAIAIRPLAANTNIEIGDITANYIYNTSYGQGGALDILINGSYANSTITIGKLTGDFIANVASSGSYGGAISIYTASGTNNKITIDDITGDFIGNSGGWGGAISNYILSTSATIDIGDITGDFIGNYTSGVGNGGAFYTYIQDATSSVTIGNITGDFIGNYTSGNSGGVFYNQGRGTITIGDITGDFIGNHATTGGVFHNETYASSITIGDITGDFVGNYVTTSAGGVFRNEGVGGTITIGDIIGDFIDNYAQTQGGVMYNSVSSSTSSITIGDIIGDFTGNNVDATLSSGYSIGGAISNSLTAGTLTINSIQGNFDSNYVESAYNYGTDMVSYGGAIANSLSDSTLIITDGITGNFVNNSATVSSTRDSSYDDAAGGAIYNFAERATITINDITGSFISNSVESRYSYAAGGAIYAFATDASTIDFGAITGDITANSATTSATSNDYAAVGGAMYLSTFDDTSKVIIDYIKGDISNNYVVSNVNSFGGAVYIDGSGVEIGYIEGNIIGNYAMGTTALGGAVYNSDASITFKASDVDGVGSSYSYTGNWAGTAEVNASDENGGFLYNDGGSVTFDTDANSSITIGTGTANYDSIAGTGSITKSGDGELVVNSSMQYYTGSLSVEEGTMTVNNILGASAVEIDSGATLTMGITAASATSLGESTVAVFSNSSLASITSSSTDNTGTLNLVASASLTADSTYTVFASGSVDISAITLKAFGGTYTDNVFTVGTSSSLSLGETTAITDIAGTRVAITTSTESSEGTTTTTAVYLAFESTASGSVTSVSDISTLESQDLNNSFVAQYTSDIAASGETYLASAAYDFDINLDSGSVLLSMYVGVEDYDVSQFTIYHSTDGSTWDTTGVSNVSYDGEYVSFEVSGFSTYGYTVTASTAAVPEPSTYAMIIGLAALGFAYYRRRK